MGRVRARGAVAITVQRSGLVVVVGGRLLVGQWAGVFADVGRPDPIPVAQADIAVVRQQPDDLAAVAAGVLRVRDQQRIWPCWAPTRRSSTPMRGRIAISTSWTVPSNNSA